MSLPGFGIWDVLDILIVAFVVYRLIALLRGTRAIQLIKGLAVLFFIYAVSRPLHLRTVNWLLQKSITTVFVALPIVFLPELRRALEQIGRGQLFHRPFARMGTETTSRLINEVARAVDMMSKSRTGALIVIENETGLNDIIETGTLIDATVSAELLVNVFAVGTPLHDGAAIIRGDRLIAAACVLPLAENMNTGRKLGTRHRAALGISEQSDAFIIVVSEETGIVSVARSGNLHRHLDEKKLREELASITIPKSGGAPFPFWHGR